MEMAFTTLVVTCHSRQSLTLELTLAEGYACDSLDRNSETHELHVKVCRGSYCFIVNGHRGQPPAIFVCGVERYVRVEHTGRRVPSMDGRHRERHLFPCRRLDVSLFHY